ncbi:MAG: helix-turn-helix transcriptional regulator [Thalassobaculum sp.]|uniref:helix-turn-helix domain-containing protein n=1 Tax=Thalassobaculum sp. TaxID=2022740 RepID=UPI0032F05BF0
MTPLGQKLRALRAERGATLGEMAAALGVSAAYLSALEHGKRGVPRAVFLELINGYFNLGWDDAEELRRLATISDPRVVLDTGGLSPKATELANRLAARLPELDDYRIDTLLAELEDP